jgi:hypothetical protein
VKREAHAMVVGECSGSSRVPSVMPFSGRSFRHICARSSKAFSFADSVTILLFSGARCR